MVKVDAFFVSGRVFSNSMNAFSLFEKERFGERLGEKIFYSSVETVFLVENQKIQVLDSKNKKLSKEDLIKKFEKLEKNFFTKYLVFKDLRKKGNIVKSALKFGAEFRVYEKGFKIGQEHAKWILFCVSEHDKLAMKDFSAKNRIAHSTNKKLLVAVVDDEQDVSYYEARWMKL